MSTPALPVPEGFQVPEDYDLRSDGVFKDMWKKAKSQASAMKAAGPPLNLEVEERPDGWYIHSEGEIAPSPIAPIRIFRDFDGNEDVELAWLHYGHVVRRFFPRELIIDGKALVRKAGAAGFPAAIHTANEIEKWLFEVEKVNALPVETVARQLGWQPDGSFVTGNGKPYRVRPVHEGMDRIILAHKPSGKLKAWLKVVESLKDLPLAQMALYASLAAPLLDLLELTSFLFHFAGLSSRGKTTSAQVGMSVWANPRVDGGAMGEWKGTRVALERRLSLYNGLPVVFDETANVAHPNVIRDMIYTIPQGSEKARGSIDGMRTTLPWSTVVISTGEASLLSGVKEGGAAARVLEVEGTPFGVDGGTVAEEVRAGVEHCYGVAGPAYVEALKGMDAKELRARHAELTEAFKVGGNLARRRAPYVAALALAAELARECGVLPFDPPEDAVWSGLFTGANSYDDRPSEALEVVWDWITAHPDRLFDPGRANWDQEKGEGKPVQNVHKPPAAGWAGKVMDDGAVAMMPGEVERVLEERGYALDAVKSAWGESGAIRRQGSDLKRRVDFGGKKPRWFVFEPRSDH